jgi:hypothetical protein
MRSLVLLILIFSLLSYGCISQKSYPSTTSEVISSSQTLDLDKDGTSDIIIYDFVPVKNNNVTLTRQVVAVARTSAQYVNLKDVSSFELLETRAKLDAFDSNQKTVLEACAVSAGLKQDCTALSACTVLCSGSTKCKRSLDKYPEAIPASMIEFVDDRRAVDESLLNGRNRVLNLEVGSQSEKDVYLNNIIDTITGIALVYSNPLYTRGELGVCSASEIDLTDLVNAASQMGNYTTNVDDYVYLVTISAQSSEEQISGVELTDSIPATIISLDDISSEQKIETMQNGSDYVVSWKSARFTKDGAMLGYRFVSSDSPQDVVAGLSSPLLTVNTLDLGALAITEMFFNLAHVLSGNFFIALGAAVAFTIVIILILYNLLIIVFNVIKARGVGENASVGLRRSFSGTELRWKSDGILGIVLLAAGYYISVFVVDQPSVPLTLVGAVDYFTGLALSTAAAAGLAGVGAIFLGVILIYNAIENKLKITVLEQAYGIAIKEEKGLFELRVKRLKEMIKELQKLVEEQSAEEFDVSQEYDVLTSLSIQRIEELSKKMNARSKKVIEDDLNRVEGAIERLTERKRTANESWEKWSGIIENMLTEQDEVYLTSLITIPASLRTWALRRYVKEKGGEGMVFERDSIKRRRVTPEALLKKLISQKLILGAVVMKNEKVLVAKMLSGSATVPSVLSLKLRSYVHSLAKSLGQHEPVSFATVGSKNVLVLMKIAELESMLIIPKDKFKEAVDEFKKKAGMLG